MKQYILVGRQKDIGKLNNTYMWRFTWYCVTDNTVWETTVDETYRNFTRNGWDQLAQARAPWGVYEGLRELARRTVSGVGVITADSNPISACWLDIESQEQAAEVAVLANATHEQTQYATLFE